MNTFSEKKFWGGFAILFFTLTCGAFAENVTFSEITEKFCRNMEALSALYSDKTIKETMGNIITKAQDLKNIYSSGGARSAREKLLREKETLETKPRMDQADLDRISKIEKDIKTADPDGSFKKGRDNLEKSLARLEMLLKNLDTSVDQDKANLVNLTLRHLQVYRSAMAKES